MVILARNSLKVKRIFVRVSELLAIKRGIERFKICLASETVIIKTDSIASEIQKKYKNKYYRQKKYKNNAGRIEWYNYLQEDSLIIEHI